MRSFCYVLKATIAVARMNSILSCSTLYSSFGFSVKLISFLSLVLLFFTIKFFLRLDLACLALFVVREKCKKLIGWKIFSIFFFIRILSWDDYNQCCSMLFSQSSGDSLSLTHSCRGFVCKVSIFNHFIFFSSSFQFFCVVVFGRFKLKGKKREWI